ncbi:probable peroxidase 26 [Prosopis cineraria]|uniref:probable peroxidase 26 n=1 Tax=Prosopis cineraria TaxID=364024 RepID=UPI0024109798|nr:probable peroxidase 26 [Prosopis cineraria]
MGKSTGPLVMLLMVVAVVEAETPPKLEWHYYKVHNTCRYAEEYVRHQVKIFWDHDRAVTPKLLRLLYADCFVTGCDASVLLDGPDSEKEAPQNRGLAGFVIIDKIKTVLEDRCPGVVSCADILHLATRDALKLAGAPAYPVFTGRRDTFKSDAASVDLPPPSISHQDALQYFKSKGLTELDMTTLLGAHSMGRTHCSFIVDRLYNYNGTGKPDPAMNVTFVDTLRKLCPSRKKGQHDPLVFLNPQSGSHFTFTESYYQRILSHEAVLGVDQQLLYGDDSSQITEEFAAGFEDFRRSFALSMYRMGNINVLTGNKGEIRRNCRYANKGS